jgi:aminoglycoside phosphotransferase (APT) family kinase protein
VTEEPAGGEAPEQTESTSLIISANDSWEPSTVGARAVRDEDAFDVGEVHRWLMETVADLPDDQPLVGQFAGGASNLTYVLHYPDRDLVLRRPPRGHKAKSAHDMHREFDIQSRLSPVYPFVSKMVAYAPAAESPLEDELYVMVHVPGVILRQDPPRGMPVDSNLAQTLGRQFVDSLADLHAVDVTSANLADYDRGLDYPRRQVLGWSKRYRAARTDDVPDGESVMQWLAAKVPDDVGHVLIHGDWRFDNLVLDPASGDVRAVLDWEMATVGDPLMDLGATLAYWVQADDDEAFRLFRRQPTDLPGMPTREEVIDRYLTRTGTDLPPVGWRFYEVYGLFRLAVIVQQIWFRYRAGQTTNPAFASFGAACTVLIERCRALIAD